MKAHEINFDGLVGPTHNYAGIARGNLASSKNKAEISHPKKAALQGLEKMRTVSSLGVLQAVLPPQERPHIPTLKRLGFSGSDAEILKKVAKDAPLLLKNVSSAATMWTANAGTVSPSADTRDKRVHITPANLIKNFHRSIEPETTSRILKAIFCDELVFCHHAPLPSHEAFGDEGAANHIRFAKNHDDQGLEVFVFGKSAFDKTLPTPEKFPARQTLEASQAVARLHGLDSKFTMFVQQSPEAIDAGVFHNDVISVGHLNAFFCHQKAFLNQSEFLKHLKDRFENFCGGELSIITVLEKEIPMADAVSSYLFNTQLIKKPDGNMMLIAPTECEENPRVKSYLEKLVKDVSQPIRETHFVDVRQSMKNGGGPACLRFRVALTENEKSKTNPNVFLTDALFKKLKTWIEKYYRDELKPEDLADEKLLLESRTALDALTQILNLGSVYDFQISP